MSWISSKTIATASAVLAVSAFVGYQLLKAPAGGGKGGAPGGKTGSK